MPDPTPDTHVETVFEPDGAGMLMSMRMILADSETCEAMLSTGMEHGLEAGCARLEKVLERGVQPR